MYIFIVRFRCMISVYFFVVHFRHMVSAYIFSEYVFGGNRAILLNWLAIAHNMSYQILQHYISVVIFFFLAVATQPDPVF